MSNIKNNSYNISDLESKRFKLNILRANVEEIEVKELKSKIVDKKVVATGNYASNKDIIKTLKNKVEEYEDVLNHFRRFSGTKATHLKSSRLNDNLYKD